MNRKRKTKMGSSRTISHYAIYTGATACLLGAIWSPEDALKWVATALYLQLVGKNFGLTLRNEKIVGMKIVRPNFQLTNFLPMRGRHD